jgi:pimeloyl-ACP methyl ester carboxylesterase
VTWILALVAAAIVYQAAVLAALVLAWRNARVAPVRTPAELGISFEEVRFATRCGLSLHGWWIPSGRGGRSPVVVLVHGWGRNVERMLPYLPILHPAGYHLLAFDARHHGLSDPDSHASMLKFSQDLRAAIDFVAARPEVDAGRIAVLGLSIGGSAAIHAAAHDPRIRAVVSAGAFADPRDAMVSLGRWSWLVAPALPLAFRFMEWRIGARMAEIAPEAVIARATARFLIIHGDADTVVPVTHARRLAAAAGARGELWVMPGRGHSDVHLEAGFPARLLAFLA